MNATLDKLRFIKNDLLPRNVHRLRRPLKILLSPAEFYDRVANAKTIPTRECYDLKPLKEDGFVRIATDPAPTQSLCLAASAKFAAAKDLPQKGEKAFFSQLLRKEDLLLDGSFLRFALDEKLLRTVAAYMGNAPFLESVELLYSKPVETSSRSQLWHKDRTDKSVLKIFVYCASVNMENGPFSFLKARDSKEVPESLPHYLADEEISKYVSLANVVNVIGNTGTAFLIDTIRCYHFGSRCEKPRLAYVAYYTSGFGYYQRETKWAVSETQLTHLSPLQRFALGY